MGNQQPTPAEQLIQLLGGMVERQASDLHLIVGYQPTYRVHGTLEPAGTAVLDAPRLENMIQSIIPDSAAQHFQEQPDLDFSTTIPHARGDARFRVNLFRARGNVGACFRLIPQQIPSLDWLGFPPDLARRIIEYRSGLVLVTGVTGSGKSTTLACLVNMLNQAGGHRIITIENPIEFIFPRIAASLVTQREVGVDVPDFYDGLKFGLRQDPDTILVGEIRDRETAEMALSAAETGHLILSTMHTRDAKGAVTRFVDLFPRDAQDDIRAQLSLSLRTVVAQHLVPPIDGIGKRHLAIEVLHTNFSVASAIRQGKIESIESAIQTGRKEGMCTLDDSLSQLVVDGKIDRATARHFAKDPNEIRLTARQM